MDTLDVSYWQLWPDANPGFDLVKLCAKCFGKVRYRTAIIGYRPERYVKEYTV